MTTYRTDRPIYRRCKRCGAEILWIVTERGNMISLSVASKQNRFAVELDNRKGQLGTMIPTFLPHATDCSIGVIDASDDS